MIKVSELEFFQFLSLYLYQNYYFPLGGMPWSTEFVITFMLIMVSLIPISIPLLYYAFKLRSFVKYSEMWQPWKKLSIGWLMLVIAAVSGIMTFISILIFDLIKLPFVSIMEFVIILSPIIVFFVVTILFTFVGIRSFYKRAKEVVEKKK